MTNCLGQTLRGDSLYPMEGKGRLHGSFKPGKPAQLKRLMRLLATEYLRELGDWTEQKLLTVVEGLERMLRCDEKFRKKNEDLIEFLKLIVDKDFKPQQAYYLYQAYGRWPSWDLAAKSLSGYFGEKQALSHVKLARVIRIWKIQPPKPYIGRGYADKGNRRDASKDATPSWQEMASDRNLKKEFSTIVERLLIEDTVRLREAAEGWGLGGYQYHSRGFTAEVVYHLWVESSLYKEGQPSVQVSL